MRWTAFLRFTRTPCSTCLRQYRQGPRRLSGVVPRSTSKKFVVPWKLGFLLGFGMLGGVSLTVVKYFRSDRTSSCKSQVVTFDPTTTQAVSKSCSTSKMAVKEFGVIQRFCLALRFMYMCLLFSPAVVMYALSRLLGSNTLANTSWKYALFAVQNAGPAFVKLGQWASTRRDLFTNEFCHILSDLHLNCTPHSWQDTVKALEASFGPDWQEALCIVDHTPIGSGCVAQVYQGQLHHHDSGSSDGRDSSVVVRSGDLPIAVKVLHPNIVQRMEQDIYLMKYVASWVDTLYPNAHWAAFTECVDEFSVIMEKQLDLEREAGNLCRFKNQMTEYGNIKFPTPIYPYVTSEVLVETFESGDQISEYLSNPGGELQKTLAKTGVEVLLDMLFVHNFVHGDLHPGNILVQDANIKQPKLVLLDCGIATSLEPLELENLHCVFTAIITGEGWKVADLFLNQKQTCSTLKEYRRKVGNLVDAATQDLNLGKVRVDTLFSDLFNIMIEHKVRIDPNFTSVMVAIMVIEGLGRSLDPNMDILAYAGPCVLNRAKQSVREHVAHRLKQISQTR